MSVGLHNIMDCFCLSTGIKTDIMLLSLFSGLYSPPRTLSTVLRSAASSVLVCFVELIAFLPR